MARTNSTYEPLSTAETLEEDAALASVAVGDTVRVVEVVGFVLFGLLICPPLAILAVVVVVPLVLMALLVGLIAAVFSVPYLLTHRLRGHRGHGALFAQRLRHAGRAVVDLMPHRIVAGVRKHQHTGR
jgi:hypothetical protein